MRAVLVVLAVLWGGNVAAADTWSNEDKTRLAVFYTTHLIDWGQTLHIVKNPESYHERNAFLGEHPSKREVNRYFLAIGAAHFVIADALPSKYRAAFQYLTIGYNTSTIVRNYDLGLKINF